MLPTEIVNETQAPGNGTVNAMMGVPLREARETFEREYLRVQIRRFS
jgi:two-component system nitrogen regulation response regulator NtrX